MSCRVVAISVILGIVISVSDAYLHRPDYLVPCSMSQNFSECALKNAYIAIPHILKGDRKYKIPNMNPLKLELIELKGINNFHLSLRNVKVYGLDSVIPKKIEADFKNRNCHVETYAENLYILGDYNLTGRIIVLPLNGHGPVNITLGAGLYKYDFSWDYEYRDGRRYATITNSSYDYTLGNVIYDFKNLFADSAMSNQINKMLTDNWKIVDEDLKYSFSETLRTIQNSILSHIYKEVPFDELFLP